MPHDVLRAIEACTFAMYHKNVSTKAEVLLRAPPLPPVVTKHMARD